MSFWIRLVSGACIAWLAVALSGCTPSGRSQLSEEKEPHFVQGKGRVNAMDYQGAIEAFEQSLEANPHSAAAHFELGWLYDEKTSDPAAAVYHYQEYLKLNPNADNADVIKQRIYRCKQQLAADVLPLPSAPAAQQQLERLSEQNRQLQDEVGKWRAYYASQLQLKPIRHQPRFTENHSQPQIQCRFNPRKQFPPCPPMRTRAVPQIRSQPPPCRARIRSSRAKRRWASRANSA
jgi:tetratricopeptide (TPR) repeat protein